MLVGCSGGNTITSTTEGGAPDRAVAVLQLRDESGAVPEHPRRSRTTSNFSGEFDLPVLPAGTYLLAATHPVSSDAVTADLDAIFEAIASGRPPEGWIVGCKLLTSNGRASWSGVTLQLSCPPDEGVRVRGKLGGEFNPGAFVYDVALTIEHDDATESPEYHCVPAADGSFDFGFVPQAESAYLDVVAGPEMSARLVESRVDLEHGEPALDVVLPFHVRVPVHLTGVPSYGFGNATYVSRCSRFDWSARHPDIPWSMQQGGAMHVVHDEGGLTVTLAEGDHLLWAHGEPSSDLASGATLVHVARQQVPTDVVLALEPCLRWTTRLVDKFGKPFPVGWICLGPEGSDADFPPGRNVSIKPNGRATIERLPLGIYAACLETSRGVLRFELDLSVPKDQVVVDTEL